MDHCTLFPEGWWAHCCAAHDLAYASQAGRADADLGLLLCVSGSAPSSALVGVSALIALAMYLGVRAFGKHFYRKTE